MDSTSGILSASLKQRLLATQRTAFALDQAQLRLASGKLVNSALDNPQNFFAAKNLDNRASDLFRLLDGIGQSIQVVKTASAGIEAVTKVLNQADSLVTQLQENFPKEGILKPFEVALGEGVPISQIILSDNPVAYWRLNDTTGATAVNLGSGASNGTYINGVTLEQEPLYTIGPSPSAGFNGINQGIVIPDSVDINAGARDEHTIELTFNANTTAGRQVLYEQGGTSNSFTIYIDNGRLYVSGRDQGAWGPPSFSTEIEAGVTNHVALVFDRPGQQFRGYVNGENIGTLNIPNTAFPNHTGNIGIGFMNQDAVYHTGPQGGSGNYFNGFISDVAIYADTLSDEAIFDRYFAVKAVEVEGFNDEYEELMDQLDMIVEDSTYRGTNLLIGDIMETFFNEHRSSSLVSIGEDFSSAALGIDELPFLEPDHFEEALQLIRTALLKARNYGSTLATNLSIIESRETMVENMINVLEEGRDLLTIADQNEEGARFLALQTRQQIQLSSLATREPNIADFLI